MMKLTDRLADIVLKRAFEKCPDLDNHEILEAWFEGDEHDCLVIQSRRTDDNGTQIFFTRLRVKVE